MRRIIPFMLLLALTTCDDELDTLPDLPSRADRWIDAVPLQADSIVTYVGKTSEIFEGTVITPIDVRSVSLGDRVNGVQIGAIKCSFFVHDSIYSGEKFMWRGRWGCHAGRSRYEVINAIKSDGTKVYDYIYISPVSLN